MAEDLRQLNLSEFEITTPDDGSTQLEHVPCGRILRDIDPYQQLSSLVSDAVGHICSEPEKHAM
jgi:hypothetical protein